MTINKVIENVKRIMPNAIEEQDLARWLLTVDGRAYYEVTKEDEPDKLPRTMWPEEGDQELLVAEPYAEAYELYLVAMIHFALGDHDEYNNTAERFESVFGAWKAWWRRNHKPRPSYVTGV